MKKLLSKTILAIIFLSAISIVFSFTNSNSAKKKVLIIQTYVSFETEARGLAILHNDKPTEFIVADQKSIYSSKKGEDIFRNMVEEPGRMLSRTLQKFYDKGWDLEGITGGDMPTYILVK